MEYNYKPRFSPTICLTHNCNLDCVYCYQKHDNNCSMSLKTACKCIDWIFENVPDDTDGIEIGFIGGEPLLEFELIKKIINYTISKKTNKNFIFFASTNGTILTDEMKTWLINHKDIFVLGLSLDGTPDTHNHNRSNSYDKIDVSFFKETWPMQGIKMTLSDYSLFHLADNIKYIHSLGINSIDGVNLCEGTFDWDDEKYIPILISQLGKLVKYYEENDMIQLDQMFDRKIELCETEKLRRKWCGIGSGTVFFDTDGTKFPCSFITPMTFSKSELDEICSCDFCNDTNFIDDDCFNNCYIYPICPNCAGANYLSQKSFKERDKSKCKLQKLITLYVADLLAKRMIKNPDRYDDFTKRQTINAILKIKELYLQEFENYLINIE